MDIRPKAIEVPILHLRSSVPIAAHLFPESQLLVSQFVGTITDDMFVRYYQELLASNDGSPDLPELVDLRSTVRFAPTARAFSLIGDLVARIYKPTAPRPAIKPRCAVLAPYDLAYGIARMYQMGTSSEAVDLQVFRDLGSALSWLEISDRALSLRLEVLDTHDASVYLFVE